jgi:hypothetical protein
MACPLSSPLTLVGPPDTLQAFMGEQPYDLLIRGGTVVDGTGAPAMGSAAARKVHRSEGRADHGG